MKNLRRLRTMIFFILLFSQCQKDESTATSVWGLIELAKSPGEPAVYHHVDSTITQEVINGELWTCEEYTIDRAIAPDRFSDYDPGPEVIFPGSVIQGASLDKATPDGIPFPAGKSALSISTLTGCTQARVEIEDASSTKVYGGLNQIISSCPNTVTANFDAYVIEVKNKAELQLELKANASLFGLFEANANFKLEEAEGYRHYLVVLDQLYYSIVFNRPEDFKNFFKAGVTVDDLAPYIKEGNPACYISSVSYGSKFYLLVEAKESSETIYASLCAKFLGNGGCGEIKAFSTFDGLKIKTHAIGGKADALVQAAMTGDVKTYLSQSIDVRNGAPISYQVRSILTDKVVKNGLATKYTLTDCKPVAVANEKLVMWYEASNSNLVFSSDNIVKTWKDKSGHDHHAEYIATLPASTAPVWKNNGVNGNGALEFSKSILVAYIGFPVPAPFYYPACSKLNFTGNTLINSDYTLFAVLETSSLDTFCLMEGTGNYGYTNTAIYFRNDSIFFTNNLRANTPLNVYELSVVSG